MTETIRIAVMNFVHETVTFLPNDTALDDFIYGGSPARGEALLAWEPRSYMGGFVKVAREHAGVELVGIESPLWPRTGTGSGWITREAYEHFLGRMIAELQNGGRWHGVYLALHGAMGVRGVEKPEADIARRVREVVGRNTFIAGTFDPHGNEDAEFLYQADFAFCAKYFPHYDSRLQGERAARMLIRAVRGESSDPDRDGAAMDWRLTVDGPGPARPHLGSARARPVYERLLRLPLRRRAGCRHDGPGDDQRQARACAAGGGGRRGLGLAPAGGIVEDGDGTSHPSWREARQGSRGARRVARGASRPFRPLWLGDVGSAAGDRAGHGRRADCHHRRPRSRR